MATHLKLSWMADLKSEHDLRALSVSVEVTEILFVKIDLVESQYNGARLDDPIQRHLVDDYKQGMRNGDTFPRIVVRQGKAGFVILGGNQRAQSIKELIEEGDLPKAVKIEAYLVATEDTFLLEIIARSGNVGHGGRSSKDERLAHAIYAVRHLGMTTTDAAKIFNVSTTSIQTHIKADKTRRDLAEQGVNATNISLTTLTEIARLPDDSMKAKVGALVDQHSPSTERVHHAVASIRKAKSHQSRLARIKTFEKELAEDAHRSSNGRSPVARNVPRRPRRDRIIRDLRRLAEFLESGLEGHAFASLADLQVASDTDGHEIANLWSRIQPRMKKILAK